LSAKEADGKLQIKMKRVQYFLIALVAVAAMGFGFSSCVTTNKAFQSLPVITKNVTLDPIKADIVVNEKVKLAGESTSKYFLFFRVGGDNNFADGIEYSADAKFSLGSFFRAATLSKVRSSAAYNALQKGNFDVLVHPTYEMKVQNYLWIYRKYTVKVSGYGAKFTNFRTEPQKVVITSSGKEYVFPDN
jgi:hypothetical protein